MKVLSTASISTRSKIVRPFLCVGCGGMSDGRHLDRELLPAAPQGTRKPPSTSEPT